MIEVIIILFLVFLSAIFSGAEIAFFSLRREKLEILKQNTSKASVHKKILTIETLQKKPEQLLVTILIVNNVVNISASAFATVFAQKLAQDYGFSFNEAIIIGIVTGIMTFFILIFGEIVPKSIAHKKSIAYSLLIARFLFIVHWILKPISFPLTVLLHKLSGQNLDTSSSLSEDELKIAMNLAAKEGKIDQREHSWSKKILELGDLRVGDIMTPRSKVFSLPDDIAMGEAVPLIINSGHSRIPIYHDDLDHIMGILNIHNILDKSQSKNFQKQKTANFSLSSPLKVPFTMELDTLLCSFQQNSQHMAMVINDQGSIDGLITMEDVLEEVFGGITDETDEITDRQKPDIRRIGKWEFEFSGTIEWEDMATYIRETLNIEDESIFEWPWQEGDENKTINFLILHKLKRFPHISETVNFTRQYGIDQKISFDFTITDIQKEVIQKVQLKLSIPPTTYQ